MTFGQRLLSGLATLTLLTGAVAPAAAAPAAAAAAEGNGPAAWADDAQGTKAPPPWRSLPRVSVDLLLGMATQHEPDDNDGHSTLGLSVLHRPSWLTVGGNVVVERELTFDNGPIHTQLFLGALGGATFALNGWFGVETLAEVGLHVKDSGDVRDRPGETEFVQEETGTSLPYAGLRVTPAFTLGVLRLGPWLHARADLARATVHTTGPDSGDLRDRTVGMTELGFGLFVGAAIGE